MGSRKKAATKRAGARSAPVEQGIDSIVAQLARLRRPAATLLQPGMSRSQIAQHAAKLPFSLRPELVTLYAHRNGTPSKTSHVLGDLWFFPGFYLLSLEEAVQSYRQRQRSPQWKKDWFPVFADGGGDFYAVACGGADAGAVIGFVSGEPEQEIEYLSLVAMLATLDECFARGAFYVKRGDFGIDDDKHRMIAKKHNPGLDFWSRAEKEAAERESRAAAIALATEATKRMQKRQQVFAALSMFEKALESPDMPSWAYVNAMYTVLSSNNGHPVDARRVRKMIAVCLPRARNEPEIFLNAAFAYLEIGEADACFDALRKARSRGVPLRKHLSEPIFAPFATDKRFLALGKAAKAVSRAR
jgi:hypothetical protein